MRWKKSAGGLKIFLIIVLASLPAYSWDNKTKKLPEKAPAGTHLLWEQPVDLTTRDLYYGQGGKENEPSGKLRFIKEDDGGTQPKFIVEDEKGVKWKVKLGIEAQSETVATRLLWAVGYFTDETYYLPKLHVEGLVKLKRGQVAADGTVEDARLERISETHRIGNWNWFTNPFSNTRELNGLRVMMALINNWDLTERNNSIYYDKQSARLYYVVHDLGATFGKSGNDYSRSKN
ncbi:MAG: hypothetical protein AB1489_31510, partial [Acidobacteriota bacterium]